MSVKPDPRSGGIGYSRARAFEDVAAAIDASVQVAGLAGDADLVLDAIVVGLELLEAERPVFDGRPLRDARSAIPTRGLARHFEVPRLSLIHISEPTRLLSISYAVFC